MGIRAPPRPWLLLPALLPSSRSGWCAGILIQPSSVFAASPTSVGLCSCGAASEKPASLLPLAAPGAAVTALAAKVPLGPGAGLLDLDLHRPLSFRTPMCVREATFAGRRRIHVGWCPQWRNGQRAIIRRA